MRTSSVRGRVRVVLAIVAALSLVGAASAAAVPTAASGERVDVFVAFADQPGAAEQALVRRAGGEIKYTYSIVPAIAASVPAAAIDALARNPGVLRVEPDVEVFLVEEDRDYAGELDNTWGVQHIDAGDAHAAEDTGAGVRVAVLDTGIDKSHSDLDHEPKCSKAFGYEDYADGHGHGTHVAGTVAALRDGEGVVGVAPDADICAIKVLSDGGGGSFSDIVEALDWIVAEFTGPADRPITVANHSYGAGSDPGPTVQAAFDNSYAAGVLHVAAAGNSGNPFGMGSNCIYPALYGSVMAVAATTQSDARASFSSTCSQLELSAPGVSINSTVPDNDHDTKSGTSMASPHVAGSAALLVAANPDATVEELRSILTDTADPLGPHNHYGYGLVQPLPALTAIRALEPTPTGTISGTVTDADTEAGIGGATVKVEETGQSATTNPDGSYTIENVPTGTYDVTASAEGYGSQTQEATVNEDQATDADFELKAVQEPDPDEFNLTVSTYKVRGISYAELNWEPVVADATYVVLRDSNEVGETPDTSFTDNTGARGSPSFTYKVCITDSDTCSDEVTASW